MRNHNIRGNFWGKHRKEAGSNWMAQGGPGIHTLPVVFGCPKNTECVQIVEVGWATSGRLMWLDSAQFPRIIF